MITILKIMISEVKFFFFKTNLCLYYNAYNRRVEDYLNGLLAKMAADRGLMDSVDLLTDDFHVYPDFHGNRSPVADASLKGMVSLIATAKTVVYYLFLIAR